MIKPNAGSLIVEDEFRNAVFGGPIRDYGAVFAEFERGSCDICGMSEIFLGVFVWPRCRAFVVGGMAWT